MSDVCRSCSKPLVFARTASGKVGPFEVDADGLWTIENVEDPRMTPDPVLTVSKICERWQCCRLTVMKAIWDGRLKAFRLGRNWRVLRVEVERFEQAKAAA
jgi:excisionase family DNA binding protein